MGCLHPMMMHPYDIDLRCMLHLLLICNAYSCYDRWCILMLSSYRSIMHATYAIDRYWIYTCYRSIMHTMHAIDRWSMSYMLSIDACLCYRSRCMSCFRSMMHVTHVIDQWCIVMLSMMMHATCYRWCMLYLSIDEAYSCCWSMIHAIHAIDRWRHAIGLRCMFYDLDACSMLSIDDE